LTGKARPSKASWPRVVLAALAVSQFFFVFWVGFTLYPWRRRELAVLALLGAIASALVLRWARSRHHLAGRMLLAGCGTSVLLAVLVTQYIRNRAINLPDLSGTRLRVTGPDLIARSFITESPDPVAADPPIGPWRPARGEPPGRAFERHSMLPMDDLLAAYVRTRDTRFLQRAESMTLSWIRANSAWAVRPPSEFSWGDHATALRLMRFLHFWNLWRQSPLCGADEAELVERSILAHGAYLADSAFYTWRHNHGVDQDIALTDLALMSDGPRAEAWYRIAQRRLKITLGDLVWPSGITREHSPGYGLSTTKNLAALAEMLQRAGRSEDADEVNGVTTRMRSALAEFVEPSGILVPFGDTHGDAGPGTAMMVGPDSGNRLRPFLEEGYAFLREPVTQSGDGWFLAVSAASNPGFAHKHCDDLSFVLSKGRRRMLVDPGAYSYFPDRWRHYFLSCDAHNTASLGGVFQHGAYFATGTGSARLHSAVDSGSIVVINGSRDLEDGGQQERSWAWIPGHGLVVADRITGPSSTVQLSYHLGSGLRARSDGSSAFVESETGLPLAVIRGFRKGVELRLIQGWVSPSIDRREQAPVLLQSDSLRPSLFVTEFVLAGLPPLGDTVPSVITAVNSSGAGAEVRIHTPAGDWILDLGGPPGHQALRSAGVRSH